MISRREQMITETRDTMLFGGLATMRTQRAIESGCLKTSENASALITRWQANPIPAEIDSETSFLWQSSYSSFGWHYRPIRFSSGEYSGSFIWQYNYVKKLVFFFISTWGGGKGLSQEKLCRAVSSNDLSNSLISSISANLNSGVGQGLYVKSGTGKSATYSLAHGFRESRQLKQIGFVPSQNAITCVRARTKKNG